MLSTTDVLQTKIFWLCSARWSASAANEQPWSYFVATRDEHAEFARLLSCVADVNLPWAKFAAVLMLGCARLTMEHTGEPYETAEHDLGLASANLVFEATARGLRVHQKSHSPAFEWEGGNDEDRFFRKAEFICAGDVEAP
jgi:nitroreductase